MFFFPFSPKRKREIKKIHQKEKEKEKEGNKIIKTNSFWVEARE